MKKSAKYLLSIFTGLMIIFISSCNSQKTETADIIFTGGTIYTVSESGPVAEAVAIIADKIIFVGDEEDALKFKGKNTQLIDLENKIMIPGFTDAHGHFMAMGNSKLILDLRQAESYDDVIKIVENAVKKVKPGDWIEGRGWHQDK